MDWLAYRRVSRVGDRAETLISPELQAERIESYASARSLPVRMLDAELDVSGGKVDRPILEGAIRAIERGEAAGLIVAQLDRLSRMSLVDALKTIERIESAGGKVIAVAENFDVDTDEGRTSRNLFLVMGDMQLSRYKSQFRSAKARAVERGIWPVPRVPIGYERGEDRRLVPSKKAPAVVRAFELRADGASWRQVAEPLRNGFSGAHKVIRNRVYLGELHLGEWHNLEAHPPIVPRDLWEAAQIHHPPPPRGKYEQALLASIVRCAACGFRMSADSGTGIYRCRPHKASGECPAPAITSMRRIDKIVTETVLGHLKGLSSEASGRTDPVEEAQAVLNAAEAELALYQEATKLSEIGVEHFAKGMRSRTQDVEAARRKLGTARGATPVIVGDFSWEGLSAAAKRQLLRGALGVVWVRKRGIRQQADFRIVAAGFEPSEFSPIDWLDGDLPGEIRAFGLES